MNKFAPGTLVAVMGAVNLAQVRRIARVVEDRGAFVLVQTDDELESEAAIEYDFATPEPMEMEVSRDRLRRIVEEQGS